jgi:NADPH:quinone reductase
VRQIRVRAFGGIDQLELADVAVPVPAAGEVIVDAHAWGVNYADLVQREGLYVGGPTPPFVPGAEAAGIVVAHGSGVHAPALGARVVVVGRGLQAERVTVPANHCIPWPAELDVTAGAAFAVSYLTAYHALVTVARAREGELVLIHAAAGGFGTAAVQIAKRLGLRVVATASSDAKRARVSALGADVVVGYEDFESAARGAAIVLESIGGDVFRKSLAILAPLGRLVTIGATGGEARPIDALKLIYRSHAVLGLHLDAILARPDLLAPSLAWLLPRLVTGELVVQVGRTMPLADVRQAHELLASRGSYGKLVLVR